MSGTLISEFSCVDLAMELVKRCEIEVEANGPNGDVEGLQDALETYLKEAVPCPTCGGVGEVSDPKRCPRCQHVGCRSIPCPDCGGVGYRLSK